MEYLIDKENEQHLKSLLQELISQGYTWPCESAIYPASTAKEFFQEVLSDEIYLFEGIKVPSHLIDPFQESELLMHSASIDQVLNYKVSQSLVIMAEEESKVITFKTSRLGEDNFGLVRYFGKDKEVEFVYHRVGSY